MTILIKGTEGEERSELVICAGVMRRRKRRLRDAKGASVCDCAGSLRLPRKGRAGKNPHNNPLSVRGQDDRLEVAFPLSPYDVHEGANE